MADRQSSRRDDAVEFREDVVDDVLDYRYTRLAVGAAVSTLPRGYFHGSLSGTTYYYYGGSYYHAVYSGSSVQYVVIQAPIGAAVWDLPPGYEVRMINGVTYYVVGITYYKRYFTQGKVAYVVVIPAL